MPYHTLQYNRNENMAITILSVLFTFEVEVLGTVNILGDWLWVHLKSVSVGTITCNDHIVPLVII